MSDESREAKAGEAAVNENQKLATQEEQITKPAPKVKPQREKDPKKVAAGKKLAEKNRQAKAALEREVKREREIAEKEQENENSAGWFPEMSFQTVLSIVGIAFTAFELYQRFRQKRKFWKCPKSDFASRGTKTQRRQSRSQARSSERSADESSGAERNPEKRLQFKIRNGLSESRTKGL